MDKWEGKECETCKEYKPFFDFYKNPIYKDGYEKMCKACKKIYNKKHYEENKQYWKNWWITKGQTKKRRQASNRRVKKMRKDRKRYLAETFDKVTRRNKIKKEFYLDLPTE